MISRNASKILATVLTVTLASSAGVLAQDRASRFRHSGTVDMENAGAIVEAARLSEAPTGFDNRTNGFMRRARRSTRSTKTTSSRCARSTTTASSSRRSRSVADGLGPTYNAQSCRECHQNVVTGGASQIAEHRTGRLDASGGFFESLGGSLIHSRATHPDIVERVAFEDDVRTFRISTNTLGAGIRRKRRERNAARRSATRNRPRSAARR